MTSLLNNMVCDGLCVRCRSYRQLVYDSVNKRRLRSWNSSLKLVSLLLLQRYETKTRRLETSVLGYWTTKSQWVNWQWEILHSWKKQLTLLVAYLAGLLKVLDWLRGAVYILWKSLKSFDTPVLTSCFKRKYVKGQTQIVALDPTRALEHFPDDSIANPSPSILWNESDLWMHFYKTFIVCSNKCAMTHKWALNILETGKHVEALVCG